MEGSDRGYQSVRQGTREFGRVTPALKALSWSIQRYCRFGRIVAYP